MKIMICGAAGFIGRNLTAYLLEQGHEIVVLDLIGTRMAAPRLRMIRVDLLRPELFKKEWFDEVEAIVNLSGKEIFTLWTSGNRRMIWRSRVEVNKNLLDFISGLAQRPKVFISASAVGYYGNGGRIDLTEEASPGHGFLADVCAAWEAEARRADTLGVRSVQVRTAPVLSAGGGILRQLMKSINFGFTFRFGSGDQWFSWIHMYDLVRAYCLAVTDDRLSGPLNACAPYPTHLADFMRTLAEYKKAIVVPFPSLVLKLLLRETSDVILFSQKMKPAKLLDKSFQFYFPTVEEAFKDIFGVKR